ncbi:MULTISPECIES: CaiB/BaiF CoA transferase family protein [unclassified Sphingomonas]|uniref:CaiB/BaiF CoA transferase family protein n=1 Tax=unclassified Sphingomonas TaxID=196159 RepID=UPI0006FDAF16|nr:MULTISPECIES: CaiB/BaiF CoA-transferase family protein [unclassified Sphingomonas]KQX23224.1 carnitine dehydratase [Sphingomonas sp. Root1294]KQY68072.1 carnitine dehydratase [Sphingomonas sp. Root50]KRB90963.1 carnitine dehydratase [Sphingomonas sp. Root720]
MSGPLQNIRIIEFGSMGPGPFACMMLADNGADVVRVMRATPAVMDGYISLEKDALARSRKVVRLDLKKPTDIARARELVRNADGIVEGFRPGVMEQLGLGPDVLLADNPKLVYGRMTGWGQDGPYAQSAGHDINYIALSGALHAIGRPGQPPVPPANLVGDFGGGGMMMAFGMVSAILHARATGQGQIVDCSMVDGSALLMSLLYSAHAMGVWRDEYGVNMVDGGAHFYNCYETADGKFVAVGAIEPQFYGRLRHRLGIAEDPAFDDPHDPRKWDTLKIRFAEIFRSKTREQWCEIFGYDDSCFSPVLSMREAPHHPHNVDRRTFVDVGGMMQPAPAPRYSASVNDAPTMTRDDQDDGDLVFGS